MAPHDNDRERERRTQRHAAGSRAPRVRLRRLPAAQAFKLGHYRPGTIPRRVLIPARCRVHAFVAKMLTSRRQPGGFPGVVRRFEAIADAIIYRWSVEHHVSATPTEVAEAREYLQRAGIATTPLPDGRFLLEQSGEVVEAPRLILLGLQRVVGRRPGHGR